MGLILLDGLEDLTSWTNMNGATVVPARNGNGSAMQTGVGLSFAIPAAAESDTVTIGFAIRFNNTVASGGAMVEFRSDAGATLHTSLGFGGSGIGVQFYRGVWVSGTLIGTTYAFQPVPGSWYYIEVQIKLHDTTGFVTARLNGSTVISTTNLDTKNAGTKTTIDTVRVWGISLTGSAFQHFDDLYLMSGVGDSFLGDIAVETLYPNGNGNANQWVGSDFDSTDNYLHVDEAGTPSTTDFVASSTSGQQDLYAMSNLARTTGTVLGVCHQAYAAKADSGARQIKVVNRRAADTKSAANDLTTSFTPCHYALANDPETAAPWTIANVNSLQSGVEVV